MSRFLRNVDAWVRPNTRGIAKAPRIRHKIYRQQAKAAVNLANESITFISRPSSTTLEESSNAAAARKSQGNSLSAIDGHLIGIKDNICTTELPTTCGSEILRDFVSPFDATIVKKIKEKGGIVAGKTNLDEFGMGSHTTHSAFGATLNPIVSSKFGPHSAGGSSGGSAAAVAQDLCVTAVGTDTGGSVRLPAAFCGVVGFKPSYGNISRYGVVAYANSLDTVGVFGRDVDDVHALYHALLGPDENDPTCLKAESRRRVKETVDLEESRRCKRPFRIGVPIEYRVGRNGHAMDEKVTEAWSKSLDFLRTHKELSFELVPVSLPSTKFALAAYYILAPAEASSNLAKYDGVRYGNPTKEARSDSDVLYAATRNLNLGAEVRRRILLGSYSLSSTAIDNYFIQAQRIRRLVQEDFNEAFAMPHPLLKQDPDANPDTSNSEGVDFLLVPTAPTRAPPISHVTGMKSLASYAYDVFTVPASLAGLPAISVPVPSLSSESPIGMQLIGQYGDDDFVLDMAHILQCEA